MDLVVEVYRLIKLLPKEETYALSDQMRRSVVSIPSNIAEGYGRSSTREYVRFLSIARGSKLELETQLLICVRLGYMREIEIEPSMQYCNEIGKMLNALIRKILSTD
jgi:four helix bundle protein